MKILHVSTRFNPKYGGGEKFVDILISGLSKNQHIFLGGHKILQNIFQKKHLEAYYFPAGFEPLTPKKILLSPVSQFLSLLEFIRFFRLFKSVDVIVDSVSSFVEPIFLFPLIHTFFPKKRLVFLNHWGGITQDIIDSPLLPVFRNTMKFCEVFFVSKSQRDLWTKYDLVGSDPKVIYNGIPINDFTATPKTQMPASIKIGFLGRMYKDKGVNILLKALSKIKSPKYTLEVILGGEGENEDEFRNLAKELHFDPQISLKWVGFVKDTKKFYEQLDVLVMPSITESFGLVLVESWERGLTVISSDIDTFRELKKEAGFTEDDLEFTAGNSDDLAVKIELFIKGYNKYTLPAHQVFLHNLAKDYFSLDKMLQSYHDLLNLVKS